MQAEKSSFPAWTLFMTAVGVGLSIFGLGFRVTDEVIVVAVPFLCAAMAGGAANVDQTGDFAGPGYFG